MNSKEYDRLRQQIQDRYDADMAALERVRQISDGSAPVVGETSMPTVDELTEMVKDVLPQMNGGIINRRTVMAKLRESQPGLPPVQDLLGVVLRKLDGSYIVLVRKGSGKRASEYKVAEALPLPADDDVLPKD